MLNNNHILIPAATCSSCGEGNPIAGQMAIEAIFRSGDNPMEEFLAMCTTIPSMGY